MIEKKFKEFTKDADAQMARNIEESRIKALVASEEQERKRTMLLAAIDRYEPLPLTPLKEFRPSQAVPAAKVCSPARRSRQEQLAQKQADRLKAKNESIEQRQTLVHHIEDVKAAEVRPCKRGRGAKATKSFIQLHVKKLDAPMCLAGRKESRASVARHAAWGFPAAPHGHQGGTEGQGKG